MKSEEIKSLFVKLKTKKKSIEKTRKVIDKKQK